MIIPRQTNPFLLNSRKIVRQDSQKIKNKNTASFVLTDGRSVVCGDLVQTSLGKILRSWYAKIFPKRVWPRVVGVLSWAKRTCPQRHEVDAPAHIQLELAEAPALDW